ncbi:MAG TPA: hypothetical protein VIW80_07515 [Pyrinomonadaceae bacterium]
MRLGQRPLLPIVLLLLLIACGMAFARARTSPNAGPAPTAVGCVDDCKEKLDKMLEKCEQIPEARRENCREAANTVYNKCLERCGD